MFDFSGDESIFMFAASIVAVIGLLRWYLQVLRRSTLRYPARQRAALAAAPVGCLIVLFVFLRKWSDPQHVAGHFDYELLFLAGGASWLFLSAGAFGWLGLSWIDDAVERCNPAAVVAVCGAMLGVTLLYAYCNIGNGPTIWTTLLPALVATLAFLVVWLMEEAISDPAEAVTVDRDVATGVRLAAFLVALGLILGRAMAGDFYGWSDTWSGFLDLAWPALGLMLAAAAFDRVLKPTPANAAANLVTHGVVPGAALLFIAAAYLIYLGAPEVAPPGEYNVDGAATPTVEVAE